MSESSTPTNTQSQTNGDFQIDSYEQSGSHNSGAPWTQSTFDHSRGAPMNSSPLVSNSNTHSTIQQPLFYHSQSQQHNLNHASNQFPNQTANHSSFYDSNQYPNQAANEFPNQTTIQSADQSTNQPTNQSTNQPTNPQQNQSQSSPNANIDIHSDEDHHLEPHKNASTLHLHFNGNRFFFIRTFNQLRALSIKTLLMHFYHWKTNIFQFSLTIFLLLVVLALQLILDAVIGDAFTTKEEIIRPRETYPNIYEYNQRLALSAQSTRTSLRTGSDDVGKPGPFPIFLYSIPDDSPLAANPQVVGYLNSTGYGNGAFFNIRQINLTDSNINFPTFEREDSRIDVNDRLFTGLRQKSINPLVYGGAYTFRRWDYYGLDYTVQIDNLTQTYYCDDLRGDKVDCTAYLANVMMDWVNNLYIINKTNGLMGVSSEAIQMPYRQAETKVDIVANVAVFIFPLVLSTLVPVFAYTLVLEKSQKLLEMQKLMGMKMWIYYLVNYTINYGYYLITAVEFLVFGAAAGFLFVRQNNWLLLILTMILWGFCLVSFTFLLSSFMNSTLTVSVVGYLIVLFGPLAAAVLEILLVKRNSPQYTFLLLIFPFPLTRILREQLQLCQESACPGIEAVFNNYDIRTSLIFLVILAVIYFILAVYIDAVYPREWGVRKHPCFCCLCCCDWCHRCYIKLKYKRKKAIYRRKHRDHHEKKKVELEDMTQNGHEENVDDYRDDHQHDENIVHEEIVDYQAEHVDQDENDSQHDEHDEQQEDNHDTVIPRIEQESQQHDEPVEEPNPQTNSENIPSVDNKSIHSVELPISADAIAQKLLAGEDDPSVAREKEKVHSGEVSPDETGLFFDNLKKSYGRVKAVRGLTFTIGKEETIALLSANGGGKSTTCSMLVGMLKPSHGTAYIYGHDIRHEMDHIRRSIGYIPQFDILFNDLTCRQHVQYYARLKGVPIWKESAHVREILSRVGLWKRKNEKNGKMEKLYNRKAGRLSGGMKRRLSTAIALAGNPKLLLCDEPTHGLDLTTRRVLWDVFLDIKKGRTVLLTSHNLDECDVLSDRIAIMAHGQLKVIGKSLELKNKFGRGYKLTVTFKKEEDHDRVIEYVETLTSQAKKVYDFARTLMFEIPKGAFSVGETFVRMEAEKDQHGIEDYSINQTSLEDVFISVLKQTEIFDSKQKKSRCFGLC